MDILYVLLIVLLCAASVWLVHAIARLGGEE